jgi:hypothetical protein
MSLFIHDCCSRLKYVVKFLIYLQNKFYVAVIQSNIHKQTTCINTKLFTYLLTFVYQYILIVLIMVVFITKKVLTEWRLCMTNKQLIMLDIKVCDDGILIQLLCF